MNEPVGLTHQEVYPVFPLPDFVLFPGITTPLHIFEPRYRKLLNDILDHKGVMCIATLQGEWKKDYHEKTPEIFELGCVCHVDDYTRLEDGRYNIVISGRRKARLHEVPSNEEYRCVQAELLDIASADQVAADRKERAQELAEAVLLREGEAPPEMHEHMSQLDIEQLLNVMCFHYPGPVEHKLKLLEMSAYPEICDYVIQVYQPLVK